MVSYQVVRGVVASVLLAKLTSTRIRACKRLAVLHLISRLIHYFQNLLATHTQFYIHNVAPFFPSSQIAVISPLRLRTNFSFGILLNWTTNSTSAFSPQLLLAFSPRKLSSPSIVFNQATLVSPAGSPLLRNVPLQPDSLQPSNFGEPQQGYPCCGHFGYQQIWLISLLVPGGRGLISLATPTLIFSMNNYTALSAVTNIASVDPFISLAPLYLAISVHSMSFATQANFIDYYRSTTTRTATLLWCVSLWVVSCWAFLNPIQGGGGCKTAAPYRNSRKKSEPLFQWSQFCMIISFYILSMFLESFKSIGSIFFDLRISR